MNNISKKDHIHLNNRYGLTVEQYNSLLEKQEGLCAACKQPPKGGGRSNANGRLFVDHNHTTGDIRGLLCQGCNAAVGLAYDNPSTLRRLADYLESNYAFPASELRRRGKGDFQRSKTHCINGHPYTPSNTYYSKNGWRTCKVCRQSLEKKRAIKIRELRKLGNSS
jgi:hypothetical protein